MTEQSQSYNIRAIRELLLAAFTPEELRRFCYDRPSFRPVVNRFGPGHGFDDMVDQLIVYCDTHVLADQLLAEIRQVNPRQYARHFGPEHPATVTSTPVGETKTPLEDLRAGPTPEILTIASSISLRLVRVPAGEFLMGSVIARDKRARDDELPPHHVHVPEFHIGQYPVTNLQYQAFVKATGRKAPGHWKSGKIRRGKGNHPVVDVSWRDAVAFCAWLNRETGQPFRLPTEAEWEKAARGTDGRIYPWGDDPPEKWRSNYGRWMSNIFVRTMPVGTYSPYGDSPYGCADMAGNVQEWCSSAYKEYPYSARDGREQMERDEPRVVRGGAWWYEPSAVRCASRDWYIPGLWHNYDGFRVAMGSLT